MDTGVARKPIEDMDAYRATPGPAARSDGGLPAEAAGRGAVGAEEAHRLRRGRGAQRDPRRLRLPERGPGHGRSWSAARTWCTRTCALVGLDPAEVKLEILNARLSHRNSALRRLPLRPAAARGLPAPRRPAADQPGPQRLRRRHGGAGRRRRHGHRRDARLRPGAGGGAAGGRPGARTAGSSA